MKVQLDDFKEKEVETTILDKKLSVTHADDARLAALGYKSEFKREFTVRLPFT